VKAHFAPLAAGLALAALLLPAGSRGQSLEVSPVVVDISGSTPSAVVTIRNLSAGAMRYQVKPFTWSDDRAGRTTLDPASDLAVFPGLFQLKPGEERKVRVGATVPPVASERVWRIMIEELPDAVQASGHKVVIRTRFSVPVFLAPIRPEVRVDYALRREGRGLTLVASNRGNVRVKPATMDVALLDEKGAEAKRLEVAPWYVLAGAERAFEVPVGPEICARIRQARAVVDGKPASTLELPGGACAP
jgi:fimbrial chaperone protein